MHCALILFGKVQENTTFLIKLRIEGIAETNLPFGGIFKQ